ncbi:MAG TPA: hypothetical protein EYQ84_10155 [Nitrospinaceae bacterium]|nr:hypothetical protein [Nitrospinaceae bacterium]
MIYLVFPVNLRMIYFLLTMLLLFGPIGCLNIGPISLKSERSKYNMAIQKTNDEQLLLNLVRLKYRDTPFFLEVSNVASQFRIKNKVSITAQLESMVKDIFNLGTSSSYQESPTVSYTPLQGDKFVKNIMSTLPLKTITLLFHSGWSVERVFRVCFQLLGHLENAPGASGPTPKLAPQYKEFLKTVKYLQELDDRDALRIIYQELNEQPQMLLQVSDEAKTSKPALEFARSISSTPGKKQYILTHFPTPDQVDHLRIVPRSLLGMLFYLSQSIEIPKRDLLKGKVTQTKTTKGEDFDWFEVTGELLTIRSLDEKPLRATVRVFYRDTWFYIDDSDLNSKSTFSLLTQIYSLQSGSIKSTEPILTIGVGSR